MASREHTFDLGELTLDTKDAMASSLLSSPPALPISSGFGGFIFYLLPFSKLDRKFLLFHQIFSLSV